MEPVLTPEMIRAAAPEIVLPTPPGEREVALLGRVLGWSDVDGAALLRDQVRGLHVMPGSDATSRIYLVHPDAPRATFSIDGRTRLPGQYLVRSPRGHVIGQLMVWIEHGHLRALQFVRHDAQPALTLPPPSWLVVPEHAALPQQAPPPQPVADEPASVPPVLVTGAQHAVGGVRALVEPQPVRMSAAAPEPRPGIPWTAIAAVMACALALATAALLIARAGGADVDAARSAGASAGEAAGIRDGSTLGTFAGSVEGELAGRMSTYDTARAVAFAKAKRAEQAKAAKAAKELAAARAAAFPNPSTCIGYWATDTTWVCST